MAVAFDAKSTAWTNVSGVATLNHSLITVGSGANRALVACVIFDNATLPAALALNWDSAGTPQLMTLIGSTTASEITNFTATMALFGLIGPTSGAKTLTATWTGAHEAHLVAVSFTGAASFANGKAQDQAAQTTGSITITCPSGDMAVAAFSNASWTFATTSGSIIQFQNTGPNEGSVALSQNGAGATVCTCSGGSSASLISSGVDVVAAGGADVLQPQIIM